jgi:hypothetical protein
MIKLEQKKLKGEIMKDALVTVPVMLDEKTLRRFTVFDMLTVKRMWRSPLIFALMMSGFATVCFFMVGRAEGAALLGTVLLAVGLGLPVLYAFRFLRLVDAQVKRHDLTRPRTVYTLGFSREENGVFAENPGGESACYEWARLSGAFRDSGCVYLYVTRNRAFILPENQAEGGDLWELFTEMLPPEKLRDKRKKALI